MSGTVNIARSLFQDDAFKTQPYTEREAFMWLVMEASWRDRTKRVGNITVELKRGQLAASIRFMAEAWQWEKSTVDRFLKRLEKRDMIGTDCGTGLNVITVCKYNDYQGGETSSGTEENEKRDSSGTAAGQTRIPDAIPDAIHKEGIAHFAEFWAVYPHRDGKRGRKPAEAKYRAAVKAGVPEQSIIAAARRYGGDSRVKAGFARDPTTWLNQAGWEDELGPQHLSPVNDTGAVDFWAAKLNDPAAFVPQTAITPSLTARLIASGLVTHETLKRRGFAA
jgi:hypothetical protein